MKVLTAPVVLGDHQVQFGDHSYPIHVRAGDRAWAELAGHLEALAADRFALVTDPGVPHDLLRAMSVALGKHAPVIALPVEAAEKAKTLATIDRLAQDAICGGATRQTVVVALGGGLAGNVAGLLAALLYRGIRLLHAPTTLLAASDSVLSLKQAVNSASGKNHLGTFYPPVMVWVHLDFLRTLPPAELRAAFCEGIKNIVAICPWRLDEMAARLRPDASYSVDDLAWLIALCVEAKQSVMTADPHETGPALVLEYGHTAGHAAEILGALSHGPAIGVGMLVAARISASLGFLDSDAEQAHELLLALNGAPLHFPPSVATEDLMEAVRLDNKRGYVPGREGHVDMVLLRHLGEPLSHPRDGGASLITQVPESVVRAGIQSRITF